MVMTKPFIDFAKAYLRYTQQLRQTKTFKRTVTALQLLETSLLEFENSSSVVNAAPRHFDRACECLVLEGFKDRSGIGKTLERIAQDLGKWQLTTAGTQYWRHPFVGIESNLGIEKHKKQSEKEKKLPNDDAILALAEVFANGFSSEQDDEDTFITGITCLLLSAPMRINEILWYRTDFLREEEDVQGNKQLHIAYWVPKNGRYARKEIPRIMAEHAREAARRLTQITTEGRLLAKHYESGSDQFYRHTNCPDISDEQILNRDQLVAALGLKNYAATEDFVRSITGNYKLTGWKLSSLWDIVLLKHNNLNPYFPYQIKPDSNDKSKPLKMSESLMCFRYQQLSTRNSTSPILLAPMNRDFYAKRLDGQIMTRGDKQVSMSFFLKHGYGAINLRSHQLRHFLNTMAQEAGVEIEQITQWSTRASEAQSRIYMHQDPMRKAKQIAEKQITPPVPINEPVIDDEYRVMEKGPIITTRYGICTHDYTLTPCQKHADCLNCSELLMCKGHKRSIAAIQQEKDRIAENLQASKTAIKDGKRVAGRWYESHMKSVARLDQLLQIMKDPSIENGSPIQMKGKDFSHTNRIVLNKSKAAGYILPDISAIGREFGEELADCLRILQEEKCV